MINTKLACEYEKQLKLNYPNCKPYIHSMGKNIILEFKLDVSEWIPMLDENQPTSKYFYISYESKDYKNDIPVTIGTDDYDGTLVFSESHKVFEMNINNLKFAIKELLEDRSRFLWLKSTAPEAFNDELKLVINEDLDICIDWAKKHGVCYRGSVKELTKVSNNDYWNRAGDKDELKYAIAIMRAVYKHTVHVTNSDDFITVNSYGLKHRFENFMDKLNNHKYFSTGTATVAAWYVFVGDGAYDSNTFNLTKEGPNYNFNLPIVDVMYFNDLMK